LDCRKYSAKIMPRNERKYCNNGYLGISFLAFRRKRPRHSELRVRCGPCGLCWWQLLTTADAGGFKKKES